MNKSYFVWCPSIMVTVVNDGSILIDVDETSSGIASVAESKESGVALRDLVPVLDA